MSDRTTNKKEYNKIKPVNLEVQKEAVETKPIELPERRGRVTTKSPKAFKKPLRKRVSDTLLGQDGVLSYLASEIIVPTLKSLFLDSVYGGLNMALYKDDDRRRSRSYNDRVPWNTNRGASGKTYTNYGTYSTTQRVSADNRRQNVRSSNRVEEYVIDNRNEALEVIKILSEDAGNYGHVTVADYYDLIGAPSEYTDDDYGWFEDDLYHTTITPVRGGFIINLPRPVAVN